MEKIKLTREQAEAMAKRSLGAIAVMVSSALVDQIISKWIKTDLIEIEQTAEERFLEAADEFKDSPRGDFRYVLDLARAALREKDEEIRKLREDVK